MKKIWLIPIIVIFIFLIGTSLWYYHRYLRNLNLTDKVAPKVTTQDITRFSNQSVTLRDFIVSIQDESEVSVEYAKAPDMTVIGEQNVQIRVTDTSGNESLCSAMLHIIADEQPPVISGVTDRMVYVGFPIDILEGITVEDNLDDTPVVAVDDGALDQSVPGEYTVIYIASDSNRNYTAKTAVITVVQDTQGPAILGVTSLSLYQGSSISYRSGIVLEDKFETT